MFICDTPLATDKGFEDKLGSDFAKSKELLKEAGYDGTPVVLLFATDTNTGRLTPIVKSLLERGGFTVDMQAMDWQTVVARRTRKEPPAAGGWNGFMTAWVSADLLDPIMSSFVGAACDKAAIGWPCDAKLEELRDAFAAHHRRRPRRKAAGRAGPGPAVGVSDHVAARPVQHARSARRTTVSGNLEAPAPVFWNIKKK